MRPRMWLPPVAPSANEQAVMRLVKRAKLFVWLREHRDLGAPRRRARHHRPLPNPPHIRHQPPPLRQEDNGQTNPGHAAAPRRHGGELPPAGPESMTNPFLQPHRANLDDRPQTCRLITPGQLRATSPGPAEMRVTGQLVL